MQTEPQKEIPSSQPVQPETSASNVPVPTKKPAGSWAVLRNRNYSLLFWGQLISAAGTQMQVVAVAWQVFLLTHSAIALGLIGLAQAIPRLIFSLVGGVFAQIAPHYRDYPCCYLSGAGAMYDLQRNQHVYHLQRRPGCRQRIRF